MSNKNFPVTKKGLEDLQRELRHLLDVERPSVLEELKEARSQGDLSENADYDAARDRQAYVEAKIRELETTIDNAVIIDSDESDYKTVRLGATVKILDLDFNEEETFTIVGSVEANPDEGKLSNASPLAQAMLDSKVGDTVTVNVENPYQVKILEISKGL